MSEFRKRIVDPMLPPIIAIGLVFVLVFSVSRILLAIPEKGSTTLALLMSAEVLGVAAVLAATSRIKASQRLVMLFMGIGLIGGGAAAASIGVRPPPDGHPGHRIAIGAKGILFTSTTLEFPVDTEVALVFNNQDPGIPHDVAITEAKGPEIFNGEDVTGPGRVQYSVPPLAEGTYVFLCTFHPTTMKGELHVGQEGAATPPPTPVTPVITDTPTPTATASEPTSDAPTAAEIVASDFDFNVDTMRMKANSAVVVRMINSGSAPHNWSLYTGENGSGTKLFQDLDYATAGETKEYKFTSPEPGNYFFQCDLHPAQMKGTITFE